MATKRKKKGKKLAVMLLSGGTGRTCEEVVQSALAQFEGQEARLIRSPNIHSAAAARRAVKEAHRKHAVICHTVVVPKVREALLQEAKKLLVPVVDILGPVINVMDDHLEKSPKRKAGLSYALHKQQFDRIDAVDYTLAHDDGLRPQELDQADVVLVGLSRVSKSVTCFYLAYRGIRAANVPLIQGCDPLPELVGVDPNKVIALMMIAPRLQKIRQSRMENFGTGIATSYADPNEIANEIRFVRNLAAKYKWRTLDVSYKGTEEVAKEVIKMIAE